MRKRERLTYRKRDVILKPSATLRDFILHEMAKRNMSGTEFARFVNVNPGTINGYIRGDQHAPGTDFLAKLARATGVSMNTVIGFAFPDIAEEMGFDADTWLLARQLSDLPESIRDLVKSLVAGKKLPGGRNESNQ